MSEENMRDFEEMFYRPLYEDPDWDKTVEYLNEVPGGDTYACIALGACRLRVVQLENILTEELSKIRPQGNRSEKFMKAQRDLDAAKNQLVLLERDYVRQ